MSSLHLTSLHMTERAHCANLRRMYCPHAFGGIIQFPSEKHHLSNQIVLASATNQEKQKQIQRQRHASATLTRAFLMSPSLTVTMWKIEYRNLGQRTQYLKTKHVYSKLSTLKVSESPRSLKENTCLVHIYLCETSTGIIWFRSWTFERFFISVCAKIHRYNIHVHILELYRYRRRILSALCVHRFLSCF